MGPLMKKQTCPMKAINKDFLIKKLQNSWECDQAKSKKRVEAISIMLKNKDNKMENFSYYDVIIRNREISNSL